MGCGKSLLPAAGEVEACKEHHGVEENDRRPSFLGGGRVEKGWRLPGGGIFSSNDYNVSNPISNNSNSDAGRDKSLPYTPERSCSSPNSITKSFRLKRQPSNYAQVHDLVTQHALADPESCKGLVGLTNLGNTCFMNTALQCLSNCVALTDFFLGYDWKKEINKDNFLGHGGRMAEAYGSLVTDMWWTKQPILIPRDFKGIIGDLMPQFKGYNQHDVQEFLAFMLDAVHEDLNRVMKKPYVENIESDGRENQELVAMKSWEGYLQRNKSIIVDTFQGQLRSTLQCLTCGHVAIHFDPFMYLTVPIKRDDPHPTLDHCIELFCKEEVLEGDEAWRCPKCKEKRSTQKELDLWKLPPVLIIHLKRFQSDSTGNRCKLDTKLDFPLVHLDLSRYVKSPQREPPDYDLFAVANHHGSLRGGHYTAFVNSRVDGKWYHMNDSIVSPIDESEVRGDAAAYVLFYAKMEEIEVETEDDEGGNMSGAEDNMDVSGDYNPPRSSDNGSASDYKSGWQNAHSGDSNEPYRCSTSGGGAGGGGGGRLDRPLSACSKVRRSMSAEGMGERSVSASLGYLGDGPSFTTTGSSFTGASSVVDAMVVDENTCLGSGLLREHQLSEGDDEDGEEEEGFMLNEKRSIAGKELTGSNANAGATGRDTGGDGSGKKRPREKRFKKRGVRRLGLVRRQSVTKPHLWPHMPSVESKTED